MAHLNPLQWDIENGIEEMMKTMPKRVSFMEGFYALKNLGWKWHGSDLWTHPEYNFDYTFEAALGAEGMELK